VANKSNEVEEHLLNKMCVGDVIQLESKMACTSLAVKRVPTGWLYTYIRAVIARGDFQTEVMTTTFVPER
jgi:hypothetical protein